MNTFYRTLSSAAFATALVLSSAAPARAQADPVASGAGTFIAPNGETHVFSFSVLVLPDGTIQGSARVLEPSSGAVVAMDVTSFQMVGDELAMAGPITLAQNAPPWFVLGATAFFAVDDDGVGPADGITGLSVVPPQFGNLTIQQIIALIGPPPPQAYAPLLSGDIKIN